MVHFNASLIATFYPLISCAGVIPRKGGHFEDKSFSPLPPFFFFFPVEADQQVPRLDSAASRAAYTFVTSGCGTKPVLSPWADLVLKLQTLNHLMGVFT